MTSPTNRGRATRHAQDYAIAHEAVSLLGTKLPPARMAAAEAARAATAAGQPQRLELPVTAQAAVAVAAVVIGAVVVGGWYWRRRRRSLALSSIP